MEASAQGSRIALFTAERNAEKRQELLVIRYLFANSGRKSETENVRIVGQALPPARMEWFARQECLSYTCGTWFSADSQAPGRTLHASLLELQSSVIRPNNPCSSSAIPAVK